ncbi:MAG: hypothetical protein OEM67_01870 [Thermoleophilia bacterium]|nr:hypothetical protein [Thermoleophilia bacterium]MDH3724594.1 hypothetical protein [Thermoleophilia bacterium]
MRLGLLAAAGAGIWALRRAPRDPRQWPEAAKRESMRLKRQVKEAVEAGKRAAVRRQAEVQREIDEAARPRQY